MHFEALYIHKEPHPDLMRFPQEALQIPCLTPSAGSGKNSFPVCMDQGFGLYFYSCEKIPDIGFCFSDLPSDPLFGTYPDRYSIYQNQSDPGRDRPMGNLPGNSRSGHLLLAERIAEGHADKKQRRCRW